MPENKKRKRGCENCRARHIKCDGALPCNQCAKRNLTCNKPSKARFRLQSEASQNFPSDQTWCRTNSKKIDFVDQSVEIARQYDGGSDVEEDTLIGDVDGHTDLLPPSGKASETIEKTACPIPPTNHLPVQDQLSPGISPHSGSDISQPLLSWNWTKSVSECSIESTIRQFKRLELPEAVIKERDKAHLVQHFIQTVGPSFDFYDEGRKITRELTERAVSCEPLLHLVCTASAKCLGLSSLSTSLEIPDNFSSASYADENNNAAASLLSRFIFNLDHGTEDTTQVFTSLNSSTQTLQIHDDFRDAVIWASLRQEVFFALMNQRHINISVDRHVLESLIQDPLIQTADDHTWCNRMLLHLFDTIQYCFGDAHSSSTYDQLSTFASTWMSSKPASFTPVFSQDEPDAKGLPEIWFLDNCAAAGMQYYHLVRILLTAHNPRVPRIGSAKKAATEWIDEQIRGHAKTVCGIAESLEEINPGHLSACMAIALAGDHFHEKEEQTILLDLMMKTSSYYGWSTGLTQKYLQETWGCLDMETNA